MMTQEKFFIEQVKKRWNEIEETLLLLNKDPYFKDYLSQYCGTSNSDVECSSYHELKNEFVTKVKNIFTEILSCFSFESQDAFLNAINHLEAVTNLLLYYWFGNEDKNYQFRTCVHFFKLSNASVSISVKNAFSCELFFHEMGICLSLDKKKHVPKRAPSSRLYWLDFKKEKKDVISSIREIQQEVCHLIEEWEYLNTIFAIEFQSGILRMEERNVLVAWVLKSFSEFQKWILDSKKTQAIDQDIESEVSALAALLISAVQKLILPASISRICYPADVIGLFEQFAALRLQYEPQDFSSRLFLQVANSAQGKDLDPNLLCVVKEKPYAWKFCFDPGHVIKAFCWSYSLKHHLILCALTGVSYFKKTQPKKLESYFFEELLSCLEAPKVFQVEQKFENPCVFEQEEIESVVSCLFENVHLNTEKTKDFQNAEKFLKNAFRSILS